MAESSWGLNAPEAVKLWSRKLSYESLKQTWMHKFIGEGSDSMIQLRTETQKGPGDRIRTILRTQLTGRGVVGDDTLEGNEENLTTYTDDLLIDQLRHGVISGGKMSEQRIPFSVREEARMGLQDWFADRFDAACINHLTGNSGQTDLAYTGNNTPTAPSSTNIVYGDGRSTEALVNSASASAIASLKYLDYMVAIAQTNTTPIRPIKVPKWGDMYVYFMHPYTAVDLRTNTSTGQWMDIQKAVLTGGQIDKNPIFTGAMGVYNNVILHVSSRIPRTTNASSFTAANQEGVYRNVFAGAQALSLGFGQDNAPEKMDWFEQLKDYGNKLGVKAGCIFGAKKNVYNSTDFGTIVNPVYSLRRS